MGSSRTQRTSRRTDRRDVAERRVGIPNMVGSRRSRISEQHTGRDCLWFNLHADRFLQRNVSLGPLVQLGFTGDLTQVGFSGQGKYWIDLPETDNRAKVVLQAGIGFVHADFFRNDTSWLIPLGIGVDYALTRTVSLTGTFLLNFPDLDTGPGTNTNVMPGLTFGIRFQHPRPALCPDMVESRKTDSDCGASRTSTSLRLNEEGRSVLNRGSRMPDCDSVDPTTLLGVLF